MALWKDEDPRPKHKSNSLEKETDRLYRVIQALSIALAEKRFKHCERDIQELLYCHNELKKLIDDLRKEEQ